MLDSSTICQNFMEYAQFALDPLVDHLLVPFARYSPWLSSRDVTLRQPVADAPGIESDVELAANQLRDTASCPQFVREIKSHRRAAEPAEYFPFLLGS